MLLLACGHWFPNIFFQDMQDYDHLIPPMAKNGRVNTILDSKENITVLCVASPADKELAWQDMLSDPLKDQVADALDERARNKWAKGMKQCTWLCDLDFKSLKTLASSIWQCIYHMLNLTRKFSTAAQWQQKSRSEWGNYLVQVFI